LAYYLKELLAVIEILKLPNIRLIILKRWHYHFLI
jgi:hypothetical protein